MEWSLGGRTFDMGDVSPEQTKAAEKSEKQCLVSESLPAPIRLVSGLEVEGGGKSRSEGRTACSQYSAS